MIDVSSLSDEELRDYVLQNRSGSVAFHAYIDRMQQRPPVAIIEPEEWSEERMQQSFKQKEQPQA